MAVCPTCHKFPALEAEAEVQSGPDVAEDGTATASVRVVKKCGGCSEEIKDYTFELESGELIGDDLDAGPCVEDEGPGHIWESADGATPEAEVTERMQTKDRHGRAIKRARYMRSYTGVTMDVAVVCTVCKAEASVRLEDEDSNGSFDELV
jgi:hypothetical protein